MRMKGMQAVAKAGRILCIMVYDGVSLYVFFIMQ